MVRKIGDTKLDFRVMSQSKCKICGKPIKQNVVNRKPKADRCYPHRIKSGQHKDLTRQRGYTLPELVFLWLVVFAVAFSPSLNEMRKLQDLGVTDSSIVPVNVIIIDNELIYSLLDLPAETSTDTLAHPGE